MDAFQTTLLARCPYFMARASADIGGKRYCMVLCEKHMGRWYPKCNGPGHYEKCCCGEWEKCAMAQVLGATYK